MPPAIQVRDLHFTYPPATPAALPTEVLSGVTFDIAEGEFVALLGRVGAGKSTLCLALDGLVPHATGGLFRGTVVVDGLDTRAHSVARLSQAVGLVFQDPESQLTQMRVEDEVAFGPENLGLPRGEIHERVEWALTAVGLAEYRDRNPSFLSGGEKQRVAIAATLAMRPRILALDEPTANLDPRGKAAVFAALWRLAQERSIAILLATQDVERAQRYAQRVLVLRDGRIAADGRPSDVFARVDEMREWGVGAPQMAELGQRLSQKRDRAYSFGGLGEAAAMLRRELKERATPAKVSASPRPARSATSAAEKPFIVAFENVSFAYRDGSIALREVSLAIPQGQFLILAGPNGSGKTTLAKHFNGLLKPTTGRVRVSGEDTARLRVPQLARSVGYVFQNPDHQIFAPTVREEIAFGLRLQGLDAAETDRRVGESLAHHELEGCAALPPATLSLGERRQVTLASVLATRPRVLVLDEPTGGLDWRSCEEVMTRVRTFHAAGGTVVLITHDVRLIAELGERVVVLLTGRIAFDGGASRLFARRELLAQTQLTAPPVVRLAQRLARYGVPPGVATVTELVDVL
jgi:energy-coupling factor transport system ATP-binding protein